MTLNTHQKIIYSLIEEGSKIIDIGCGAGKLLKALEKKNVSGHGLELESEKVSAAVSNGLSVIQGDADNDLQYYPDNGFDYAILALSLQSMKEPKHVLEEALRIAKHVMVVIPNFGSIENRLYLFAKGRMPVTSQLSYQWYETPNIHFCTISDFVELTKEIGCTIEKRIAINKSGKNKEFKGNGCLGANLFSEHGVFELSKN